MSVTLLHLGLRTVPYGDNDDVSGITVLLLAARMSETRSKKVTATCEIRDCNKDIVNVWKIG